jgi:hypothetical protein
MNPGEAAKVFIGNLAFEVPPQVVYDLFAAVGPIKSLQLHPDTKGRALHRGSGIVEFADGATAQRAIDLVNGQIIAGRPVRVTSMGQSRNAPPPMHHHMAPDNVRLVTGATQEAAKHTDHMSPDELWHVMAEAKALAETDPEGTKALLERFPALTHALLTTCNKLGLIAPSLKAEIEHSPASGAASSSSSSVASGMAPSGMPAHPHAPTAAMPASVRAKKPLLGGMKPPTAAAASAAPTPAMDPRLAAAAGGSSMPADPRMAAGMPADPRMAAGPPAPANGERETIQHILDMSDHAVAGLDPAERAQVQHIRDALMLTDADIHRLPPPQRDSLLQARAELQAVLGRR